VYLEDHSRKMKFWWKIDLVMSETCCGVQRRCLDTGKLASLCDWLCWIRRVEGTVYLKNPTTKMNLWSKFDLVVSEIFCFVQRWCLNREAGFSQRPPGTKHFKETSNIENHSMCNSSSIVLYHLYLETVFVRINKTFDGHDKLTSTHALHPHTECFQSTLSSAGRLGLLLLLV
jgi:hypothetical protein